jgi:hypothetical protein
VQFYTNRVVTPCMAVLGADAGIAVFHTSIIGRTFWIRNPLIS